MTSLPKIYCAVDTPDLDAAKEIIAKISPAGVGVKLGMEFFNFNGSQGVRDILENCDNPPVFLDLKYHDIPNTVAGAVRAACAMGVSYLNVHASGGLEMMRAAKQAAAEGAAKYGKPEPKLLAVTLLTSIDQEEAARVGFSGSISERVVALAELTKEAGLDGVVCSALEIKAIRAACGPDFVLMVPGIRPAGSDTGDQKRVMTPKDAMAAGATHLVIGRPITQATDPARAAQEIMDSL